MAWPRLWDYLGGALVPDTPATSPTEDPATVLASFRRDFYQCLTTRADTLFELTDAVLCTEGPVTSLVGLSPAAEHRRGHGDLYDGLGSSDIESPGCV